MTKEEYFGNWLKVIDSQELDKIVNKVNSLYKEKSVMPEYKNIFKAFNLCKLEDLKVVMLGQDPYFQKGIGTGIAFGNKPGTKFLSPSLEILKEAAINYEFPHPPYLFDITLESWAKQGVLMLNSALTVEQNNSNSHTMIWRPFISKLLSNLSTLYPGMIYVLFGSIAQTFEPYITTGNIIKEKHPSYYARIGKKMPSTVFEKVNLLLKEKNNVCINWCNMYD